MPIYKCVAACMNAVGEPDLFFCKAQVSEEDFYEGYHYDLIIEEAKEQGYYGPFVTYDEVDSAGKALCGLFMWETATIKEMK